jgi:hypothetical protein
MEEDCFIIEKILKDYLENAGTSEKGTRKAQK